MPRKTMLTWLNDMYALEEKLVSVLEAHIKDAQDYPEVVEKMQEHLEETLGQAQRVKDEIEKMGGDISSAKVMTGKFMAMIESLGTELSPDKVVRNAIADYAVENFEIASYNALRSAASYLEEDDIVAMCDDHLSQEEDMADWLDEHLPSLVESYIEHIDKSGDVDDDIVE